MRLVLVVGAGALLVVGGWVWLMLPWGTSIDVGLWPGATRTIAVPAALLPLIGIGISGVLYFAWFLFDDMRYNYFDDIYAIPPPRFPITLSVLVWGFAMLLFAAVDREVMDAGRAALVFVCGAITLLAAAFALAALRLGDAIEVSSHWGGLGGAAGGWRLSPVTTLLLLVLVFLGATVAVGDVDAPGGGTGNEAGNDAGPAVNSAQRPPPAQPPAQPPAPSGGGTGTQNANAAGPG